MCCIPTSRLGMRLAEASVLLAFSTEKYWKLNSFVLLPMPHFGPLGSPTCGRPIGLRGPPGIAPRGILRGRLDRRISRISILRRAPFPPARQALKQARTAFALIVLS